MLEKLMTIRQVECLLKEWLNTLSDDKGYWDGVFASDKDIAEKLICKPLFHKSFIFWLREKEI